MTANRGQAKGGRAAVESAINVETPLIAAFDAHVLLDSNLSMKAKGLAAILLSTGTWAGNEDISTEDLISLGTDGRDSILAGLRELEEAGYLTRTRRTGDGGRIYWQRTMRARPVTAKPVMAQTGGSLDTVSSDGGQNDARTNDGISAYGDASSTSGDDTRTSDGKSGHGADPDLTRAQARTDQDINTLSSLNEEEEYIDSNFSLGNSPHSLTPSDRARTGGGSLGTVSSEKADPALSRLCFEMLTSCGVKVSTGSLYPKFKFEHVRAEVIRFRSEFATDYARQANAGALVHRIRNGAYIPLTEAERLSADYLRWRTEAERTADQQALVARSYALPPPAPPPDDEPPTPEGWKPSAVWRQLQSELAIEQGGSFDRWVHDTWVIAYDDGEFLIGLPDPLRLDWIVNRLSKKIKRKLGLITGRQVDVKWRVQPRPRPGIGVQ